MKEETTTKISPHRWYTDKADEAAAFYASVVATATEYLPEAVSSYLRLPREWADSRPIDGHKTSLVLLIETIQRGHVPGRAEVPQCAVFIEIAVDRHAPPVRAHRRQVHRGSANALSISS